jgi:catechol 2,3-dioxygenase-like lactoylglutathione lyase family enzyme
MSEARTYPEGVTSWIDIEHPDIEAAQAFYRGLFGWTFADATPPRAASRYVVAKLDGVDAAGIGGSGDAAGRAVGSSVWNTYVAVTDIDAGTPPQPPHHTTWRHPTTDMTGPHVFGMGGAPMVEAGEHDEWALRDVR